MPIRQSLGHTPASQVRIRACSRPTQTQGVTAISTSEKIKIVSAALDEVGDTIVLRGVIAPESLHLLKTDDYQREALPLTALSSILEALEKKDVLPDIELGMRGSDFTTREDVFYLKNSVYIVDGLQRVTGALHTRQTKPEIPIRIGVTIHFNTDRVWESERFRILNTLQSKVSPNILLRNMRSKSPALLMLYGLSTNDRAFPLYDRVSWGQRMNRGELISALTFAKVIGLLHSHKAPTKRSSVSELVPAIDKAVELVGIQIMRENAKSFMDLIDRCWGVKRVQYRESAIYMRMSFLGVLAKLLADHTDFWKAPDEKRLFIEADLIRKIGSFPINDPTVVQLAGASGKSRDMLYMLLRDHINSGKRTRRLTSRTGDLVSLDDEDDERAAA